VMEATFFWNNVVEISGTIACSVRLVWLAGDFHRRRCITAKPDALDLLNECLSIVEQTTDDKAAERVLVVALWPTARQDGRCRFSTSAATD
jgi:hypothetical protein